MNEFAIYFNHDDPAGKFEMHDMNCKAVVEAGKPDWTLHGTDAEAAIHEELIRDQFTFRGFYRVMPCAD